MNQEEKIRSVIDRVLWTAGATDYHKALLARAIEKEIAAPVASAAPSGDLPPLPEMEGLQDIPHALNTPDDWDADYANTWSSLQVAERNKMQWRAYALQLRAKLEEIATKAAYSDCPSIARAAIAHQPPKEALTEKSINAIWESLPGLTIIKDKPQDQWNRLLRHEFAEAIIAATAPNKQLVEALKEACDLIRLEVEDGVHTEEYRRGIAALAAAGVEVAK